MDKVLELNQPEPKQPELKKWEAKGGYVTLPPFGHEVFYRDAGNPDAAPLQTLLLLHGFPESSFSYHKVLDGLSEAFDRIVLFDMLGYGLSDKPDEHYSYSIFDQVDLALQVWKRLGVQGGHLLAHDMGDSVATELAARHAGGLLPGWFSEGFQSFTFTNGSMALELAALRVTQKMLLSRFGPLIGKLMNFPLFKQQVHSAHGNDNLTDRDIALLWNNIRQQEGEKKSHLLIEYINDRRRFEKTRWLPALGLLEEPVHLCWGEADAVAKVDVARYLKKNVCPGAALTVMPLTGHFCQLGNPGQWLKSVLAFY